MSKAHDENEKDGVKRMMMKMMMIRPNFVNELEKIIILR